MNKRIFFNSFFYAAILLFNSCQKKFFCPDCKTNKPPVANAGADQKITLPKDSVVLDGSASIDTDGTLTSFKWTKLAGPATFTIITGTSKSTVVKSLSAGVYQIELRVTDDGGLSAKDTVQVIVDAPGNQTPIACAGADQTIMLPVNTVNLNGICSTDPDNNITTYQWTKISGPSTFNMANANAVQTHVNNLTQGVYQFELKVTDAGNQSSKDTLNITVIAAVTNICGDSNRPVVNARLIEVGTLSQSRSGIAVASAGNKVLFAGGENLYGPSSRVDIYDLTTQTWTSTDLSAGRYIISAVANGNKIFFAGGESSDGTWPVDTVDIYDVSTTTWTVSHLSTAGHSMAAVSVGNKVLFTGGDGGSSGPGRANRVDIYDLTTNKWSTTSLSEVKRGGHVAVSVGSKVYIAGGSVYLGENNSSISNKVDVYDNATNSWSTLTMKESKAGLAGIAVDNKIYWAGGVSSGFYTLTCSLEIKDVISGNSNIQYLYQPSGYYINDGQNAVVKDNKLIFYSSYGRAANKVDIFEPTTNTWSIGVLPVTIEQASIISVNNTIYLAGGLINGVLSNKVWKLEF